MDINTAVIPAIDATKIMPIITPEPPLREVCRLIVNYQSRVSDEYGAAGFIYDLLDEDLVIESPLGRAEIVADSNDLGVRGIYMWIVRLGSKHYRLDLPGNSIEGQHVAWGNLRIAETKFSSSGSWVDRTPMIMRVSEAIYAYDIA